MKPLHGCRVLDLGIITAGAATSALLADLGADVIKVESAAYRDPFRMWTSEPAPAPGDDLPPFFRMTNRNKRSLALNLKEPSGREAFLALVANSHVVVENFSRGVLDRLGLGYDALRAARPDIILASISSQGETGPDARYSSFGSTLEAVSGMAWMTGYADGPPTVSGIEINYPDQVVALFAAGMVVTAWRHRDTHGVGAHLDLSQRELTTYLCGDAFAGGPVTREGNAQAPYAIQDCFACADGEWIAASLHHGQADRLVAGQSLPDWAAKLTADKCLAALHAENIAASRVLDAGQVLASMGTQWHLAMQTLPDGRMVKGFPLQFDEDRLDIHSQAAPMGTDTIAVLREIGGLSEAAIQALLASAVAEAR